MVGFALLGSEAQSVGVNVPTATAIALALAIVALIAVRFLLSRR